MREEDSTIVLVVEDERNLADIYTTWLKTEYEVLTAYGGEEALEYLEQADIVLLDRRMPGLSGDELLEEIRGQNLRCRVAMVTAVTPDFDIIEMGFDDYVVKPVSKTDLLDTVERLRRRIHYDAELDEYATLVSKKAALEAEKSEMELLANDEFQRLKYRLNLLQDSVDTRSTEFDENDVAVMFRDISTMAGL